MSKNKIYISNNINAAFDGKPLVFNAIKKALSIRVPGAFHSPQYGRGWDGKKKYISETGIFKLGMLQRVIQVIENMGESYDIEDYRDFDFDINVTKHIGNITLKPHQFEGTKYLVNHEVGGVPFTRGIFDVGVGGGKTFISAGIHQAFQERTLYTVNSKAVFESAIENFDLIFGRDNYGVIASGYPMSTRHLFTVAMVQTIKSRMNQVADYLMGVKILLVDEADVAVNKTYFDLYRRTPNAFIKVGMTGTPFKHKNPIKNYDLESEFGAVIFRESSVELVKKGETGETKVTILKGTFAMHKYPSFDMEYEKYISHNIFRNAAGLKRAKWHLKNGRKHIVLVVKYHKHAEILYKMAKRYKPFKGLKVAMIHHEIKNRSKIIKAFSQGKVDILISSEIIKRGVNINIMQALINLAGGYSKSGMIQLWGRATRKHKSKTITYVDDFYDKTPRLTKHSNMRAKALQEEIGKDKVRLRYKRK